MQRRTNCLDTLLTHFLFQFIHDPFISSNIIHAYINYASTYKQNPLQKYAIIGKKYYARTYYLSLSITYWHIHLLDTFTHYSLIIKPHTCKIHYKYMQQIGQKVYVLYSQPLSPNPLSTYKSWHFEHLQVPYIHIILTHLQNTSQK